MALEFYQLIQTHAQSRPDHPAIIDGDQTVTYAQLLEDIERFAAGLDALDLKPDSKLGLFCLNQKESLVGLLGALLKGVPVIPYNVLLTPDDLAYITHDAGIDCLLINPLFVKAETVPFFASFPHRILTAPLGEGVSLPVAGTVLLDDFLREANPTRARGRHTRNEGIPDVILYTSGTTARPKGVMLNESMFAENTAGLAAPLQFSPEDRAIMALPLFHSFGNVIALLFLRVGGSLILLPQFHPKSILDAIARHKATVLPLVPTIYSFLVQVQHRTPYDTTSLKYCISGGAALPHALLHQVEETFGVTVLEGYGLTETSPVISVNTMAEGSVVGSVGPVLDNLEVKIVDEAGNAVPQGEVGEIIVKGPTIMPGYWQLPEETAAVLSDDGWLRTGDLGHIDEKGRLYISAGRKKDLIIRAGENVSPLAIENALMNHPAVAESAAIGIPHDRLGEQVIACVVPREGESLEAQTLRDYCRQSLPAFMVPDRFDLCESLPKNPIGKVLKAQLHDERIK
jgi:long-chain acyl-CoA synthetase